MPYNPWSNPYQQQLQSFNQFSQMYQAPQAQMIGGVDNTVRVNGKESAYQFCQRMGPNSTSPAMFDTTNVGIMYIGTTDGAGVPTIEAFDFYPHKDEPAQPAIDPAQYVSRDEFNGIMEQVRELKEAINGIHGQTQPTAAQAAGAISQPIQPIAAG